MTKYTHFPTRKWALKDWPDRPRAVTRLARIREMHRESLLMMSLGLRFSRAFGLYRLSL